MALYCFIALFVSLWRGGEGEVSPWGTFRAAHWNVLGPAGPRLHCLLPSPLPPALLCLPYPLPPSPPTYLRPTSQAVGHKHTLLVVDRTGHTCTVHSVPTVRRVRRKTVWISLGFHIWLVRNEHQRNPTLKNERLSGNLLIKVWIGIDDADWITRK